MSPRTAPPNASRASIGTPATADAKKTGCLYLIPNLLGIVPPAAVLPERTIAIARGLEHFVVETPKAARAFIKALAPQRSLQSITFMELEREATADAVAALLAPAMAGNDVGLVSDAGCPAIADPGALLVAAAHRLGVRVVPLVGPSAVLLALMASGMNGQNFCFHGYLPVVPDARVARLARLEADSSTQGRTQLFIETPYRNAAMLDSLVTTLKPTTRLCVAVDLTLPGESIISRPIAQWRGADFSRYSKRPALFVIQASPVAGA